MPVASARMGPMIFVSLTVEILRSRPAIVFWFAALAQAALWTLVPAIFYSAPPGDLPETLAVGREFQLGTYLGPPLAFWLAELAFRVGGMTGVYALSQACVVVAYWAVFALGRAIVGERHAALAVLLMVGIAAFTVPTPDFGPAMLALPLWALALLHYWRAVGEGQRRYWLLAALDIGLLLLTTYAGLVLFGLVLVFTLASERGRASLNAIDPWIAAIIVIVVLFPHLLWLESDGDALLPTLARLHSAQAADQNLFALLRLAAAFLLAHAGLALLVAIAFHWGSARRADAPEIVRKSVDPFARQFVLFFAFAPALAATIIAVLAGRATPVGGTGPLLVLSGLALIVAAPDRIGLNRQGLLNFAWASLLIAPPALAAIAVVMLPRTLAVDVRAAQPAQAMGQFFAENFQRRTGHPLAIVAGDPRIAALVALGAQSRPSVYLDATPERSPWVSAKDVLQKGAVVVWPADDTAGTPPPAIRQRFPDLVPELPHGFARGVQGRMPLMRIGWGADPMRYNDVGS